MLKEEAANSLSLTITGASTHIQTGFVTESLMPQLGFGEKEKNSYSGGVSGPAPDVEEGFAIGQDNQGTGNPAEKRKAGSNLNK